MAKTPTTEKPKRTRKPFTAAGDLAKVQEILARNTPRDRARILAWCAVPEAEQIPLPETGPS